MRKLTKEQKISYDELVGILNISECDENELRATIQQVAAQLVIALDEIKTLKNKNNVVSPLVLDKIDEESVDKYASILFNSDKERRAFKNGINFAEFSMKEKYKCATLNEIK